MHPLVHLATVQDNWLIAQRLSALVRFLGPPWLHYLVQRLWRTADAAFVALLLDKNWFCLNQDHIPLKGRVKKWKLEMAFAIRHRPPPLNGTNFQTFFTPLFLLQLNPTYTKRMLHLLLVKNIISKSSYNWFKIDTLQLLYDYIKQNTFWQSGNDPKWFLNQFCCWKKLLRPLIIGSKLTFISSSGRWLPTI